MKRAYSVQNVLDAKFKILPFEGKWLAAVGQPELTGTMIIYGPPKNGKTSFAMQLAKYLTSFGRVAYNSVEEGLSLSLQMAMERTNMQEVGTKLVLLEQEDVPQMLRRLKKPKSPDVIFIDSVQFLEMRFAQYKQLKETFPNKLFVYVSHVDGKQPEGNTAKRIWRDASVVFSVEGFKAFPVGRYGGGEPLVIAEDLANKYWGLENL